MEVATTVLGGLVIAFFSAGATKVFTGKNKVNEKTCLERRESCEHLNTVRLDAIQEKLIGIEKKIDRLNSLRAG